MTASNTSDSFGNATNTSFTSRYQFTGRELDAFTGLQYNRVRWYDPGIGRFISEDPIGFAGGDVNLYGYVSDNPVILNDPLGLCWPISQCVDQWDGAVDSAINNSIGSDPLLFGPLTGFRHLSDDFKAPLRPLRAGVRSGTVCKRNDDEQDVSFHGLTFSKYFSDLKGRIGATVADR